MRVILVPAADRPECANALRAAFTLGQKLDASICGCHIRSHRSSRVALPAELYLQGENDAEWGAALKGKSSKKQSSAAKALFSKVAESHGYPIVQSPRQSSGAMWMEKVGAPDKILAIMGPVADLIVVSRPARKGSALARLFMLAALLNSSKPVLLLPQSAKVSIGRRISIAWNQSPEAAQAVSAAIPLLRQAEEVNIIACGTENSLGPKSTQLANYLRFWGIDAKRSAAQGADEAQALIQAYHDNNSDLLVMGAYSRSRLRQRLFGGVTEHMLHKATIPVFMLHT